MTETDIIFGTAINQVGRTFFVQKNISNLAPMTSSVLPASHFSTGNGMPASVRVSWRGFGGTFFAKKVPPNFILLPQYLRR